MQPDIDTRGHSRGRAATIGGLDEIQTSAFLDLVEAELRAGGKRWAFDLDGVVVDERRLGLENVARTCRSLPRAEWEAFLHGHFAAVSDAPIAAEEIGDPFSRLAVRLYADDATTRENLVGRTDIPNVVAGLVLDLEETLQSVPPDQAASWGKTNDELFEIAPENLRQRPVEEGRWDVGKLCVRTFSEPFYGAAWALMLEAYPGCVGRYGAFVGVPVRNQTICLPLDGPEAFPVMNQLLAMVEKMHANEPYPVSATLYYYNKGTYEPILVAMDGGKMNVHIPPGLAAVMQAMKVAGTVQTASTAPVTGSRRVDTSLFSLWIEPGWEVDSAMGLMLGNRRFPEAFMSIMAMGGAPAPEMLGVLATVGMNAPGPARPERMGPHSGVACTVERDGICMKSVAIPINQRTTLKCTWSAPAAQFAEVSAAASRMLATLSVAGATHRAAGTGLLSRLTPTARVLLALLCAGILILIGQWSDRPPHRSSVRPTPGAGVELLQAPIPPPPSRSSGGRFESFNIRGVRLGASRAATEPLTGQPFEVLERGDRLVLHFHNNLGRPAPIASIRLGPDGRVERVAGDELYSEGQLLVRKGDPLDKVERVLGTPDAKPSGFWHYGDTLEIVHDGQAVTFVSLERR